MENQRIIIDCNWEIQFNRMFIFPFLNFWVRFDEELDVAASKHLDWTWFNDLRLKPPSSLVNSIMYLNMKQLTTYWKPWWALILELTLSSFPRLTLDYSSELLCIVYVISWAMIWSNLWQWVMINSFLNDKIVIKYAYYASL